MPEPRPFEGKAHARAVRRLQSAFQGMRGVFAGLHHPARRLLHTPGHLRRPVMLRLYRFTYRVGDGTLGLLGALGAAVREFWHLTLEELYERLKRLVRSAVGLRRTRAGRGELSLSRAVAGVGHGLASNLALASRARREGGLRSALAVFHGSNGRSLGLFWERHKNLFNYIAPALGVAILAVCISFWRGARFTLEVGYNGRTLGETGTTQSLMQAVTAVEDRVSSATGRPYELDYTPTFRLKLSHGGRMSSVKDLSGKIVASTPGLRTGYGLYVDGALVAMNPDRAVLEDTLSGALERFRDNTPGETVAFVQRTDIRSGLFPLSEQVTEDGLRALLTQGTAGTQVYTAQKGDSPTLVASRFSMTLDTLRSLNPSIKGPLKEGQPLLVKGTQLPLTVKVIRSVQRKADISYGVNKVPDGSLYQGVTQVKSPGAKGKRLITTQVTYVNGVEVGREDVASSVLEAAVDEVDYVGTKQKPTFSWPIGGGVGYISCPYGGYSGHTGVDIACNQGTSILASADGTVIFAGWNSGFGNCVVIDHHNGWQTLYGHSSRLLVRQGQEVKKGQVIALVGHTGHVIGRTGNHLHFQLQTDEKHTVDPLKYLPER